jgi:hypothetical protein
LRLWQRTAADAAELSSGNGSVVLYLCRCRSTEEGMKERARFGAQLRHFDAADGLPPQDQQSPMQRAPAARVRAAAGGKAVA